jgi:hypothetical protein
MTAIDWLIEQIESCKITMYNDGDRKRLISLVNDDLIEQSKQMEKQQITDAYKEGCFDSILDESTDSSRAEEYYEINFNQPKQ